MLTLLNIPSGVALLMWGMHIVRTGIPRVLGAAAPPCAPRNVWQRQRLGQDYLRQLLA
ncbi:hypothetical protein AWB64_02192 [Caballeronia sordidicola]|uniref:Uncharacterized protein n=1 Tax=Caballeronia sordidicola TaxID=196367 RepID=A0A158G3V2_CABSO|nr:hypothetical protein [Caballeronia sordidicola]SAL26557.1 hypothetical protein AWB64_02192 [Caballeronia sordidicola]